MPRIDGNLGLGEGSSDEDPQRGDADSEQQPIARDELVRRLAAERAQRQPRVVQPLAERVVERRRLIAERRRLIAERRLRVSVRRPLGASRVARPAEGAGAEVAEDREAVSVEEAAAPVVTMATQRPVRRRPVAKRRRSSRKTPGHKVRSAAASRRKVRVLQRKRQVAPRKAVSSIKARSHTRVKVAQRKPAARVVKSLPRRPPKRPVSARKLARRAPFANLEQRFLATAEQVLAEAKSWPLDRGSDRKLAELRRIVRRFAELTR